MKRFRPTVTAAGVRRRVARVSMRQPNSIPALARDAVASPFVAHDPAFDAVVGEDARLVLVAETDAHEGPVYVAEEDALYFTTVRREGVAIKRLALADGLMGRTYWYTT